MVEGNAISMISAMSREELNELKRQAKRASLERSIKNKLDLDHLKDVCDHGADAGFSGFIYHHETRRFFLRHKRAILEMVSDLARDLGEDPGQMVGSFYSLKYYEGGKWTDDEARDAVYSTLYGGKVDDLVANALAWFALEEVARAEVEKNS